MSDTTKNNIKGFITDVAGNTILPITRGELVLDASGNEAFHSEEFAATADRFGLLSPTHYTLLESLGPNDTPNADNLASILTKLNAINEGIKVGNTTLNFYDKNNNNNQSTPIIFKSSETISLTADSNNNITASLIPLPQYSAPTTTENVVANVTVDEYGRVTKIESTTALSGVHLTGCTADNVADNAQQEAIVNKKYVDEKFSEISAISTGALKFEGPIDTANNIATLLKEGSYYLAANNLENLEASLFHGKTEEVTVNRGDTLIAHSMQGQLKFTIIPSGDDGTYINLSDSATGKTTIGVGTSNIALASPFVLTNDTVNNITTISIPEANEDNSGILSAKLYKEIQNATAKSMSYKPILPTGVPLGEIQIGDNTEPSTIIYSPDYSLKYQDDAIKWQGYNKDTRISEKLNIQFGGGLLHTHSADTSTIQVNLGTNNKYLKVENGVLTAVISEVDVDSKFTPGLINNKLFQEYTTILATVAYYEPISKSLNNNEPEDENGPNYQYGSSDLRSAIKVEI